MSDIDKNAMARNFSHASGTYNFSAPAQAAIALKLAEQIEKHRPVNSQIVADFGCGTGFMSAQLRRIFPSAELECVDLAPGMLERCRKLIGSHNANFTEADIETVNFPQPLDVIASNYALQWADREKAISNIVRLLRPGGLAALAIPVAGSFFELHKAYYAVCGHELNGIVYPQVQECLRSLQNDSLRLIANFEDVYTVKFPGAISALRSLKRIGANFSRHKNYKLLAPGKVIKLLNEYDKETLQNEGRVGLTYRTFYLLAQKI